MGCLPGPETPHSGLALGQLPRMHCRGSLQVLLRGRLHLQRDTKASPSLPGWSGNAFSVHDSTAATTLGPDSVFSNMEAGQDRPARPKSGPSHDKSRIPDSFLKAADKWLGLHTLSAWHIAGVHEMPVAHSGQVLNDSPP